MVEPDIPARQMARLTRPALFQVGFTIQADGSVGQVGVRTVDAFRSMESAVLAAVQQWRYAPLARALAHQVDLVINPPQ
ncbi:MAG: energy transducer TonB [Aquabacterium sp.]